VAGVVYESLLPFLAYRDGFLVYVLKEPGGRSVAVRELNGALLADDHNDAFGKSVSMTTAQEWPLDELHGGIRSAHGEMMHFGARHMFVEDGRWLQPEPLLYMGMTNGDVRNPLGYGPLYARGNSNMYEDPSGEMAVETVAVSSAAPQLAGAAMVTGAIGVGAYTNHKLIGEPMRAVASAALTGLVNIVDAAVGLVTNAASNDQTDTTGSAPASQAGAAASPGEVDAGASQGGDDTRLGAKIAGGHAGELHLGEVGAEDLDDLADIIDGIMDNPDAVGDGPNGQTGYWSDEGILVIENPNDPDGGTVFAPTEGRGYFEDNFNER